MSRPDPRADPLPPKELVLEACSGRLGSEHPVLRMALELARLHATAERAVDARDLLHRRMALIRGIDRWLACQLPPARGGAHLHTESVGTVIDRLARYSSSARSALVFDDAPVERHYAWRRLAELAVGYADLSHEVSTGVRRVPDLGNLRLIGSDQT
ncbi:DUF4254 domain-containing protein [Nocardia farcinica]|uniref:DUF4254 domain-containing protein n=3 Tax=Nocardia farcinica TaxID=37329 RepID=A0A0H5P3R2_NOCFR|nr:DUF4254 domain-containing protein [Nocardia farcinica]PFW98397.1 hypothetical protein CJ469_06270 [Nocardia farcinica]PFX01242.1 hypothetical protein CJ468_06130 [Nocardia farcinica]CRY82307.1 Uncharacterised protein [Nocardia farcinica]SIT33380.1 Protein of unknown function [Nocardia farcinica]SUE32185.1 Uncharacterised protein [Nocardia farcinica]